MFEKSAAFYDALYSFKDYEAEAATIHELIQQHCPGAATLLDVACGTGKHLELLRAHYEVEGLDLDANLLEVAQRRNPGVPLHAGDMIDFDLGRTFDAVICLFSSIAYVQSRANLGRATCSLARHVAPGGVMMIEPWWTPGAFEPGHLGLTVVDEPDLKICRMNTTRREGGLSLLDFHYLVGTSDGIEHLTETHRVGLFTVSDHLDAMKAAGMEPQEGADLTGRGLHIARKEN